MEFVSSFLYGGHFFYDQYLTIDEEHLIYEKETSLFGITSNFEVIPKKYIRKISIINGLLGCKIEIHYTYPFKNEDNVLICSGFSLKDAFMIKNWVL